MKYELKYPAISDVLVDYHVKNIFNKANNDFSSTIVAFPGSGKLFELRYLIKNIRHLPCHVSSHVYGLFDLALYLQNQTLAFTECVNSIVLNTGKEPPPPPTTANDFLKFLLEVLSTGNELTLIVNNSHIAYLNSINTIEAVNILTLIKRLKIGGISFIFIADREFDIESIKNLRGLGSTFLQNIVLGKDFLFDPLSAVYSFGYQEQMYAATFLPEYKKMCADWCYGDPSALRLFVSAGVGNVTLQTKVVAAKRMEAAIEIIGVTAFQTRFNRIFDALSAQSLNCLKNNYSNPTDFLRDTGLVIEKNGKPAPLNELFDYFVKELDVSKYPDQKSNNDHQTSGLPTNLNGQEIILYKMFLKNIDSLVTKEQIASALWGDLAETKYSDWAIDQVISRFRKSILEAGVGKKVRTLKGKGYIFS